MEATIGGEQMRLLWQKALWLPVHRTLVAGDLHFGKVNHFRKAGIAVPSGANEKNTENLIDIINQNRPERVVFLGDLFHSHYNEEWQVLGQVLQNFPNTQFELVRGNHDILSLRQYEKHRIEVHENGLKIGGLFLTHEPTAMEEGQGYNLAGHLHPGVRLYGKGRQALTFPCFYFADQQGLLPAFGSFTGLALINPKKSDRVYVVAGDQVKQVN